MALDGWVWGPEPPSIMEWNGTDLLEWILFGTTDLPKGTALQGPKGWAHQGPKGRAQQGPEGRSSKVPRESPNKG